MNLSIGGFYKYRKEGEKHSFEATTIHMLQSAVGTDSYSLYKKYSNLVNAYTAYKHTRFAWALSHLKIKIFLHDEVENT